MRNIDIEKLTFPVVEKPIFMNNNGTIEQVEGYKAIVREMPDKTQHVFSVVSNDYVLVSNELAIELGKEIFRKIFNKLDNDDFKLYNVIVPSSFSFFHIDIRHKSYDFKVLGEDIYFPFIRLSNSYNRLRSLSFDLGFYRKECSNGVLFSRQNINFTFFHTKNSFKIHFTKELSPETLSKMEVMFQGSMLRTSELRLDRSYFPCIAARALNKKFNIFSNNVKTTEDEKIKMFTFIDNIKQISEKYTKSYGETVYAAFNTITEYASNYQYTKKSGINSYQRKAGSWLVEFSEEVMKKGFNITDYLNDFRYIMN